MRLLRPAALALAALALVALVALPPAAAAFPRDLPYADIVLGAARCYRVDPALVHAVIAVESAYRRYAVSPAGAQGLMQLMPSTQADYGVSDPFNVRQNVYAGVAHFRRLIDEFGTIGGLAAYNAGPGVVRRSGGVPPWPETRLYVRDVVVGVIRLRAGCRAR